MTKEYLPILGLPAFRSAAQHVLLTPEVASALQSRMVTAQALSGTGALRLSLDTLRTASSPQRQVLVSNPTWNNHKNLITLAGLTHVEYRYLDTVRNALDLAGMLADLEAAPAGSIVILHACAHNPTGVDPSQEQWHQLSELIGEKGLFPFFDFAYQGFASGDPEKDAYPVRHFLKQGHQIGLAQSFAKNFGLYGERAGLVSFTTASAEETKRMMSQLLILIRPMYSNPPLTGARLVSTILSDPALTAQWRTEVKVMADRIITMRQSLRSKLEALGSKKSWEHITNQIGMFCYTGMTQAQCERLIKEHSIYLTKNGRISVAGLTSHNVDYVAQAMHEVTKD